MHNYQGVNLSASTKLSWQKKPEQINNPEQSLLEEKSGQDYQIAFFIILNQLEDSILEVTPLKIFFLSNIFGTSNTASFLVTLWIQSSWFLMKGSDQDPHFS